VDWESEDENWMSCLEIAKKKKHSKIVKLLKVYRTHTKETLPELAQKTNLSEYIPLTVSKKIFFFFFFFHVGVFP
jgi:hypothetical protein